MIPKDKTFITECNISKIPLRIYLKSLRPVKDLIDRNNIYSSRIKEYNLTKYWLLLKMFVLAPQVFICIVVLGHLNRLVGFSN